MPRHFEAHPHWMDWKLGSITMLIFFEKCIYDSFLAMNEGAESQTFGSSPFFVWKTSS
ncbi:hypothetical protein B4168_1689 [Anoxybacillus flavithermus]|nr:hypothetical protein B4168_1689 [Anoxybacillus flavithermus]OAO84345.1 hypothetical protein GT23_3880 [Parageobacillus thermoglucosidasius]